jgi:CheY-like chemotaxis protein
MAKSGPIIIVEDDMDDQEIYAETIRSMGIANELVFFKNAPVAFQYLKQRPSQAFIIICDINLPGESGLDLKQQIDDDPELRHQSIPFVFISTTANQYVVTKAYTSMTVQGFFQKSLTFAELKETLSLIFGYWKLCEHPNVGS